MEAFTPDHETDSPRQKLARELVAAARRGEILTIEELDPRDTSIEVVQQIRRILKHQGVLPQPYPQNQL